jgi:hypothetical protein
MIRLVINAGIKPEIGAGVPMGGQEGDPGDGRRSHPRQDDLYPLRTWRQPCRLMRHRERMFSRNKRNQKKRNPTWESLMERSH